MSNAERREGESGQWGRRSTASRSEQSNRASAGWTLAPTQLAVKAAAETPTWQRLQRRRPRQQLPAARGRRQGLGRQRLEQQLHAAGGVGCSSYQQLRPLPQAAQ